MSVNLSKGPIWGIAVIVGLIAATVLVAGYVDRPGNGAQVAAAANADGAGCPAKADGAACPAKDADACCDEAGACAACPESCPPECCCAEAADSGCPMKAAAATGKCGGGQCSATQ